MTDTDSEYGERDAVIEEPVQADYVGALLCATRMRLGGDLQEIAKILRIRYGYLVAIEDGRYEDLPGATYSLGFVRAYADYLNLDGNEVVRRLREESAGTVKLTRFELPAPSGESSLPNGGLLAVAIGLGMVVYGAWYTTSNADPDAVDFIQEVPSRLAVWINDETKRPSDTPPVLPVETDPVSDPSLPSDVAMSEQIETQQLASDGEFEQDVSPVSSIQEEFTQFSVNENESVSPPQETAEFQGMELGEPAVQSSQEADKDLLGGPESFLIENTESGVDEVLVSTNKEDAPNETVTQQSDIAGISSQEKPQDMEESPTIVSTAPEVEESIEDEPDPSRALETENTQLASIPEPSGMASEDIDESNIEAPASFEAVKQNTIEQTTTDPVENDETLTPEASEQKAEASLASEDTDSVIELRAKSDSWIQVRDGDDLLLTRLLRKGEVYRVPDREGLTLMTGNAGGIEVFIDGEQMPPLGDEGVVRGGVSLNADRLKSGIQPG
jgi:cytoskeleton protein RodZ